MRKSTHVPLTLLATLAVTGVAASATGCDDHPEEIRSCVDAQNHIVPDQKCKQNGGAGGSYGGSGGGGYTGGAYRYVYGGSSGLREGDTVIGGSSTPRAGYTVVSGEEAARGGFGRSGFASGEGGGEGGGHGGGGEGGGGE